MDLTVPGDVGSVTTGAPRPQGEGHRTGRSRPDSSTLTLVAVVALPAVCCGLPALAGAGILAAIGGELVTGRFWLLGAVLLLIAGTLVGRRWVGRGRCAPPSTEPSALMTIRTDD